MLRIVSNALRNSMSFVALVLCGASALGENVSLVPAQKISQLKAGAERGFVQQEIELANAYFVGDGVPQDPAEAAHWYEKAAEAGHAGAQNEIGYFYEAGIGVPMDVERSAHWFQLAAASGSAQGTLNLGVAYLAGRGVAKDEAMAASLITTAFHKGSGTAASYLGDMYYFGFGEPLNRSVAESWYEAGVKLRDPMAAYRMGTLYSTVDDHIHDFRKAVVLLRASAEGGYIPAMHSLGLMLLKYPKLAKSEHEAEPWLEEAANAGNWRSSIVLGILGRDGKGTSVDSKAAYFHFQVAARQGGAQAQRIVANDLRIIGAKLGADEQAELISAADAWSAQHSRVLLYINKNENNHSPFPAVAVAVAPPGSFVGELVPLTSR
jgi:uncharacterized protein